MERLVTFDSVHRQLLAQCAAITDVERVAGAEARGRRLARDVMAHAAYPAVALSTSDGLAMRAEGSVGASPYNPLPATGGESVEPGDTLPAGSDAVAPWELIEGQGATRVVVGEVDSGQGVCRPGQLLGAGARALVAGRALRGVDCALLVALGQGEVELVRRPVVELVFARPEIDATVIRTLLQPRLEADGAEVRERVADAGALGGELRRAAAAADLVLVVGGTGEGPSGIAPAALAAAGTLQAHQVAMRPGRGAGWGCVEATPVLLVPAEPVAACAVCDLLAGPSVRTLAGAAEADLPHCTVAGPLTRKVVSSLGELGYLRASVEDEGIRPQPSGTELDLPSLSRSEGFLLVAPDSEGYPPGTTVTLYRDRC